MPRDDHPAGCTCAFCAGPGAGSSSISAPAGTSTSWGCGDFCCMTTCHVCGAGVFFVRHNGGSVWFDDLGYPWPKHPCFDDDYYGTLLRKALEDEHRKNAHPVFGVVAGTVVIDPGRCWRVTIRCSDGTVFDESIGRSLGAGALVIIERAQDGAARIRLISDHHPTYNKSRHKFRPQIPEGTRVVLDLREYVWNGRHWYDASDNMMAPTGLEERLYAAAKRSR